MGSLDEKSPEKQEILPVENIESHGDSDGNAEFGGEEQRKKLEKKLL